MSKNEPLLLDTLVLLVLRVGYALTCRKFLLSALNPTLRELSKEESLPTIAPPTHIRLATLDAYSDTDDDSSKAGTPLLTPNTSSAELSEITERPQVLRLHHGKASSRIETKKRGTRGLSRIARILFSLCFAEACNLVSLVGFHELGFLHTRSREVNFSLSFYFILVLILLVLPLLQCLLLTYRTSDSPSTGSKISFRSRLAVACVPFALYCFAFTFIPPYVTYSETSGEEWQGEGWLASTLGRVVVVGVVALAGLSGFGAVRTAWNFLEYLRDGRTESLGENDLLRAEQSLYHIRQELAIKQDEVNRAPPMPTRGWIGRVFGSTDQGIEGEMAGLQAMERQTARSLRALKKRKGQQEFSRTLVGQIYNLVGYGFATYCGARLVMCLPSVFFAPVSEPEVKGNSNGDWISYLVAVALSHFPSIDINVALWSRTISLLLTGVLILSSLAQILRSVGKIVRLTSKTAGASFLLLALGQLFSVYVISLLIQMRASIQATDEDSLLKTLPDFRTFGRLFDIMFLLAALGTAIFRYISLKVD